MARRQRKGEAIRLRSASHPLVVALALVLAAFPAARSEAALISGNYQINWDQDVDKTDTGTTDIRKFKQTLELKYKGFVSPLVRNELSFKFEQEVTSNAPSVTRILPALNFGLKGKFWNVNVGGRRTHENSDAPEQNPKIADSYFAEFFYLAPKALPDLKAKYTLDKDFQDGVTDTSKQGIALSSVYKPVNWVDLKGDYTRNTSKDNRAQDADTEDEKSAGTVGVRRLFSDKLKADAQYSVEISRGATLVTAGGATSQREDQTHTVKSALAFRPFRDTSLDGSYDFDLKQNKVNGEHTLTNNAKVAATQKIWKPVDFRGDFTRNITEARHTQDDNEKTEDTWTAELTGKFAPQLALSFRYQNKETEEVHADPAKNISSGTDTWTLNWMGELMPFWKAQVSYDKTDTLTAGSISTIDTKYGLRSTFDFKAINLTLEPSYDIALKEDLLIPQDTDTRDFKFKIAYKVLSTRTVEAKVDHTYGRKTDSAANNIQRTDSSSGTISWTDPVPGWLLGFDVTRAATDTSGDDLLPDITSTFGFKADYKFEWLKLNTSYKYDKKSLSDDSETFDAKAAWTAPKWDVSLAYSFNKTFSEALTEGYTVTLTFKYGL